MNCGCKTEERVRYRHRVTVQKPKTTQDGAGHVNLTEDANWTNAGTWQVRFITRGGRESRVFDQVQAETTHIVEGHSTPFTRTIIPKWRLKFGTRVLNITAAYDVNEERGKVRCECTEAV